MKHSKLAIVFVLGLALFIRFYQLTNYPPGLYSDEAAYGFNAYSLLTTGRDEHGKLWPLTLRSFGDYKPPMTAWITIPTIALFGLNEFAVRFPAALLGTMSVCLIYLIAKEIFPSKVRDFKISPGLNVTELSALLLAISPWHIHFSRMSMLVGIENFFLCLGFYAFIKFLKNEHWLYLAALAFAAAIYTYYGSRILVPLLLLSLSILFFPYLLKKSKTVIKSGLLGLFLLLPLIYSIATNFETLSGRAKYISIFYNESVKLKLWRLHTLDGQNFPVWLSRFFHNKVYFYFRDVLRRYLSHFSPEFLFVKGDPHPPFDIPNFGQLYFLSAAFALAGLYYAVKKPNKKLTAAVLFMLISPISSSFSFLTPAANRSFNLVTGWTLLTALGIYFFLNKLKANSRKIAFPILLILYLFSFANFIYQYTFSLPEEIPHQYHNGIKALVSAINQLENKYDHIVISTNGPPLHIFLAFYKQFPAEKYWQTKVMAPDIDELGWEHTQAFANYQFVKNFDWEQQPKQSKTLYVGYGQDIPDDWSQSSAEGSQARWNLVKDTRILFPNGKVAYKLMHLEKTLPSR